MGHLDKLLGEVDGVRWELTPRQQDVLDKFLGMLTDDDVSRLSWHDGELGCGVQTRRGVSVFSLIVDYDGTIFVYGRDFDRHQSLTITEPGELSDADYEQSRKFLVDFLQFSGSVASQMQVMATATACPSDSR